MKLSLCAAAAMAAVSAVCPAQSWTFAINSAQQVPVNASPATGTGTVNYFADTNVLTWDLAWSGLIGIPTAMHFHFGAPGQNGMHAVHIMSFTAATSGTSAGAAPGVSQDVVNALMAGNIYLNIHTTAFSGGEIRGQVVPAPATAGVLVMGFAAAARRRRR